MLKYLEKVKTNLAKVQKNYRESYKLYCIEAFLNDILKNGSLKDEKKFKEKYFFGNFFPIIFIFCFYPIYFKAE